MSDFLENYIELRQTTSNASRPLTKAFILRLITQSPNRKRFWSFAALYITTTLNKVVYHNSSKPSKQQRKLIRDDVERDRHQKATAYWALSHRSISKSLHWLNAPTQTNMDLRDILRTVKIPIHSLGSEWIWNWRQMALHEGALWDQWLQGHHRSSGSFDILYSWCMREQ